MWAYIRQIPSAHVISDSGTLYEHLPNLKVTAQLLYIVTDAECDGGVLL